MIELLIVLAIFGIVLAGTSQMVVGMLTTHRQQSKIAESNIEGIIGLEMLRQDLGKAGFGLPWNGLTTYTEATGNPYNLNDASNPPRGIVSKNDGGWNGTDYLVIKAANVATNTACNKWTFLSPANVPTVWTSSTSTSDNFADTDRVIILSPGSPSSEGTARTLITSGSFFAQFGSTSALASTMTSTGIVYGIDPATDLRMPFNRADFYVKQPATAMPQRCALGTGILYKAVVNQSDGNLTEMPLLDCVADMQVIYRYDPNGSGSASLSLTNDISTWSAQTIRDNVKEVRVYVLAQEGQKDPNFTYPGANACVGCDSTVGITGSLGRQPQPFNFSGITNWQNYRWKIYTLVVKLDNLL